MLRVVVEDNSKLKYSPRPLDTKAVALPREIIELTEQLARNTHENWSRQRLAEGWRYGPVRDDARKEHPSLVPYEELSESEKQYDRTTALETLKAIMSLGYRLEAPSDADTMSPDLFLSTDTELAALRATLDNLDTLDLSSLFTLWQSHVPDQ